MTVANHSRLTPKPHPELSDGWFDKSRHVVEDRGHSTPCWIWKLRCGRGGYGQINIKRGAHQAIYQAHRVYYEGLRTPVGPTFEIYHLCRQPSCVNPDHLQSLPRVDHQRLEARSRLVLTPEQVQYIRSSAASGRALARELGVNYDTVNKIRSHRPSPYDIAGEVTA